MVNQAPKNGEFLNGKLWFERKGSIVTLGLTHVGVEEIGDIERIEFPNEGDDLGKGDFVLALEGSTGRLEVVAPASGVVHEVNQAAQDEPERVSEDPLEEGWLVKIEVKDPSELREYAV